MEDKTPKKPLSLLEIVREAVKETEEEERELERYYREMMKERLLQKEDSTISETDTVFKFRKTPISFLRKLIDRKEIKNKKLNLKKEIADIKIKIEYLDIKHDELEEEKLNIGNL